MDKKAKEWKEKMLKKAERYKPFPETSFFVICDKCNKQIFMHEGWSEYPEGKITFNVKCGCGFEFQHVFVTATFRREEQARLMTKSLSPKHIKNIFQAVKEKIEGKNS